MPPTKIQELSAEIDACRVCAVLTPKFVKPPSMNRGGKAKLMIIGQGPGNQEVTVGKPFAGPSGKALDKWLIAMGESAEAPRKHTYLTSAIKCVGDDASYIKMVANCRHFLVAQIIAVKPFAIITLGAKAFYGLGISSISYNQSLCKVFHTSDLSLINEWGFHTLFLPLPHPSGLNRWHNTPGNKDKLNKALATFKEIVNGDGNE